MNLWCFMCQVPLIPFARSYIQRERAVWHCSCECRIIYYSNISYGCSKSRDTRVWLLPHHASMLQHIRHINGALNRLMQKHGHTLNKYFLLFRLALFCRTQGGRRCQISWAAFRSLYNFSFVSYVDSKLIHSPIHSNTLENSSTPKCHVISLQNTSHFRRFTSICMVFDNTLSVCLSLSY